MMDTHMWFAVIGDLHAAEFWRMGLVRCCWLRIDPTAHRWLLYVQQEGGVLVGRRTALLTRL